MGSYRLCMYPDDMTLEERLDALAEVLAEGFLYLAENGLLEEVASGPDDEGSKESAKNSAESPCFPSEQRISFLPDDGGGQSE